MYKPPHKRRRGSMKLVLSKTAYAFHQGYIVDFMHYTLGAGGRPEKGAGPLSHMQASKAAPHTARIQALGTSYSVHKHLQIQYCIVL